MTENNEAALTTTIKIGGGKDDPWIVLRSRDAAHLQAQLMELGDGSAATTLGQVTATVASHYRVGKDLDAAPLKPQPTNGSNDPQPPAQQAAPPQQQAPAQQPPAPAQQPPAPQMQQPPAQQMPAPQQAPQQMQQGQPGQQGWPQQAHENPWQAQQQPVQQPSSLAPAPTMPNAPMVMLADGPRPARFQSGSGSKGAWKAFFDPRQQHELAGIPIDPQTNRRQSTDDPNHPGLAAGTHEFCMWLR